MKSIKLKQYIQVVRTVTLTVDDDCDEKEAAEQLDSESLCLHPCDPPMSDNAVVISDWAYVSDMGIENLNGEVVLNNEA